MPETNIQEYPSDSEERIFTGPGSIRYDTEVLSPIVKLFPTKDPLKRERNGSLSIVQNYDEDHDSSISPVARFYMPRLSTLVSDEWRDYLTVNEIPADMAFASIINYCNKEFKSSFKMPETSDDVVSFFNQYEKLKKDLKIFS